MKKSWAERNAFGTLAKLVAKYLFYFCVLACIVRRAPLDGLVLDGLRVYGMRPTLLCVHNGFAFVRRSNNQLSLAAGLCALHERHDSRASATCK